MKVSARVDIVCILADMAVDEGAMVQEGQLICQVESMKTMFPVYAPASGKVHFRYALGEILAEGDLVATIDVKVP